MTEGTRARWPLVTGLVAATAALLATGVILLVRADGLRTEGALANRAVVDPQATGQVISQVSSALTAVLSYDYTKPQVARQAAQRWLTGNAPKQYDLLFKQLQIAAKGQNLTLTSRVVTAGVTWLAGSQARLLVFVDQQSTRASDQQMSIAAAQVQITAVRHGTTWQISELKPL